MQFSIFTVLAAAASFAVAHPTETTSSVAENASPVCGDFGFRKITVEAGQTLTTIAQQFRSGICDIARLNNLADPNVINAGQELIIPVDLSNPDNTSCLVPVATAPCVNGGPSNYTIKANDTFNSVAQALRISTDALIGANPGVVPENLQIDQVIQVPVC
ncbi:Intracellular hyphae protein 1 [Colletotrichum tanaceti]|uniref:Intracellular hyphae protein 1 n=1 Tax=Colletotrichum tanaceti TaxID=1306861 RepID=A0A4V6DIC1_9PEZI|nr:Intracellular hyphae protein 1 [Colletotrichum tanaceti]TKW59776.1 Intracellular hyphae protein 1 [Colletotrichum tanaceti]